MSAAGSILEGVGELFKGFAANAMGRSQYNQLNAGADQVRYEGGIASGLTLDQGQRQAGDLIVNAAASGGGTSGSALNVLNDLERQISAQAKNTVITAENQGRSLNYQARVAKRQGVLAEDLGFLNAGASFLNANDQADAAKAGVNAGAGG